MKHEVLTTLPHKVLTEVNSVQLEQPHSTTKFYLNNCSVIPGNTLITQKSNGEKNIISLKDTKILEKTVTYLEKPIVCYQAMNLSHARIKFKNQITIFSIPKEEIGDNYCISTQRKYMSYLHKKSKEGNELQASQTCFIKISEITEYGMEPVKLVKLNSDLVSTAFNFDDTEMLILTKDTLKYLVRTKINIPESRGSHKEHEFWDLHRDYSSNVFPEKVINAATFDADNRLLVATFNGNIVNLWYAESENEEVTSNSCCFGGFSITQKICWGPLLENEQTLGPIKSIAFNPKGDHLFTFSYTKNLTVFCYKNANLWEKYYNLKNCNSLPLAINEQGNTMIFFNKKKLEIQGLSINNQWLPEKNITASTSIDGACFLSNSEILVFVVNSFWIIEKDTNGVWYQKTEVIELNDPIKHVSITKDSGILFTCACSGY